LIVGELFVDLRIIIFIAVFAVLLWIGRMLSASSEVHAASLPVPAPQPVKGSPGETTDSADENQTPLTGAEIEFPVRVPPVERKADGHYNRPNILNYYFGKTDLVRGPADPTCFLDEFFVQAQDPESKFKWTYDFTIATPPGMQQVLKEEKFDSLFFEGRLVVVERWNMQVIMQTVMEEIIKSYGREEAQQVALDAKPEASTLREAGFTRPTD
jgi:hypothetical protein